MADGEVTYSVKELIQGLSEKIDLFMSLLGNKADQSSVAHANERIDGIDRRLTAIEHSSQANDKSARASQEFRRWMAPVLLSIAMIAVTLFQALHG